MLCLVSRDQLLGADTVAKVLRQAAAAMGADSAKFSCHSLRCVGATALLSSGVDSTLVMLHGRWRSDVFQRYTRYNQQAAVNLAMQMAGAST
ncbi:hypothetical protein PF008_g28154 [Phytophthora fragariae]|uniref:Tyr recombinase domain-containing protein n=1 Tax=Phytophthora fragariae TaxID=53985 RepID=A0A6G0QC42_9STRA|nr:hypothetical protein PF008_g28154 [Phytophthora fragariae]